MTIHLDLKSITTAPARVIRGVVVTHNWRAAAVACTLGIAAIIAILHQTTAATVSIWANSATFNHGFLILPVSAYLIWLRRVELAQLVPVPDWRGMALVLLAGLGWAIGDVTNTMLIQQLGLVTIIQALVFTVLGWRVTHALLFPLFYLYFSVPFGDDLVPYLQTITAFFTVDLLQRIDVPVFVDGLFISTPTGNFLIAEACAGLRYLISTIALGAVFANVIYHTAWRRLLFIALSVIVPIIANGIRAFGIVATAYFVDDQTAVIADHVTYGWVFFSIVTVLLLSLGMAFRERAASSPARPSQIDSPRSTPRSTVSTWLSAATVAGLVAAIVAYADAASRLSVEGSESTIVAPMVGEPWHAVGAPQGSWQPVFAAADLVLRQSYVADDARVDLHIGYYAAERQDAEAVTMMHQFTDEREWRSGGAGKTTVEFAGRSMTVAHIRLAGPEGRRLVWYWYWIGGEQTGNRYLAKLLKAKAVLLRRDPSAAIIMLASGYREQPAEAQARLQAFLDRMGSLNEALSRRERRIDDARKG